MGSVRAPERDVGRPPRRPRRPRERGGSPPGNRDRERHRPTACRLRRHRRPLRGERRRARRTRRSPRSRGGLEAFLRSRGHRGCPRRGGRRYS
ncbi:hypothetical protein BRC68_07975 [Halobacteriales archaeon QH_6_64_20]|nr:MAG: hypothetical protein BRC68_07975 [Halobacteriales archaeon QH_6_64_20]